MATERNLPEWMGDNPGCACGGTLIYFTTPGPFGDVAWNVCDKCGGAITRSGKYLPPRSGWTIPPIPESAMLAGVARNQPGQESGGR